MALFIDPSRRKPFEKSMAMVDVEDQDSMTAVFEIITDARGRHIEQFLFGHLCSFSGWRICATCRRKKGGEAQNQKEVAQLQSKFEVHIQIVAETADGRN